MSQKLFVGNFPWETTESDLEEVFARCGAVASVNVVRDMATGRSRGFAFVEMGTAEDAKRAISELHGFQIGGRTLTVNEARPKTSDGRGGGGGDRGPRRRSEPRW